MIKFVLKSSPGFRWAYRRKHACEEKCGLLVRKQSGVCQFETSVVWHIWQGRGWACWLMDAVLCYRVLL